ncbi:TIGR03619 family F420-dependent LLM class oxidoreductase [Microlunatus ginsengisoli]
MAADRMRFAVMYNTAGYGTDPDALVRVARHAEACGFESILFPEHIALHPGATLGGHPIPPTLAVADPLECLTFVAAATDRLLLGTAVLLLPYRHPVVLAKQLATIDLLSRGRLRLLTVGLGTIEREAGATGVDFASRGRRADEAIDVLRALWTGGPEGVSYEGEFFAFTDLCVFPQPSGPLPIHVGGSSRAAARRAGRRGDGFFPGGMLLHAEREAQLDLVRSTARAAGREPAAIEYTRWGSIDLTPARVAGYAAQGVDRLVVSPSIGPVQDQLEELSAFAEQHIAG